MHDTISLTEYTDKLADLQFEIATIKDQIELYHSGSETVADRDEKWLYNAKYALRCKQRERLRTQNELTKLKERRKHANIQLYNEFVENSDKRKQNNIQKSRTIHNYIVKIIRPDYSDDEWEDIVAQATEMAESEQP